MKKTLLPALLLIFALIFTLAACDSTDPWSDAIYTENTSLGEGTITYYLEVIVEEHSVTFTLKTDKTTLGEALRESGIVEGENLKVDYQNGTLHCG